MENGVEVASARIWSEALAPHLSLLSFQLSHKPDVALTDLTLRFSYGQVPPTIALDQSLLRGWPSPEWTVTDPGVVECHLDDLGFHGQGTILLDFYVGVGSGPAVAAEASPTLEVEATLVPEGLTRFLRGSEGTARLALFTPEQMAVDQ